MQRLPPILIKGWAQDWIRRNMTNRLSTPCTMTLSPATRSLATPDDHVATLQPAQDMRGRRSCTDKPGTARAPCDGVNIRLQQAWLQGCAAGSLLIRPHRRFFHHTEHENGCASAQ